LNNIKKYYDLYTYHGLKPVACLGYSGTNKDYRKAKIPLEKGYNKPSFNLKTLEECESILKQKKWIAWCIPKNLIVLDIEDPETIINTIDVLDSRNINYALHSSNNGIHIFLKNSAGITGSTKEVINTGDTITFKSSGQLVTLAPVNNREWDIPLSDDIGEIPVELYPKKDGASIQNELKHIVEELKEKGYGKVGEIQPYIMPNDLVHNELIKSIADMLNVHYEVVYMYFLSIVSGLIGNAGYTHIRGGWNEPLFLWFGHIGEPGYKKTPIMNTLRKAITSWQVKNIKDSKRLLDNYETDMVIYKAKKNKISKSERWEKKEVLPDEPRKPSTKRFYVTDFTFESLSDIYDQNGKGVSILIDELAGLFYSLNAYKDSGKDEQILLEIYNGGSLTVDRVTKGARICEKSGSSIAGGIQPNVFKKIFSGLKDKGDGMLGRFNILYRTPIIRKMTKELSQSMYQKSKEVTEQLENIYKKIDMTFSNFDKSTQFKLSSEAEDLFIEFENEVNEEIYPSLKDIHMKEYIPKILGKCARFAGVLRAMEFCSIIDDTSQPEKLEISADTMEQAICISKFLIYEANKIYSELLND